MRSLIRKAILIGITCLCIAFLFKHYDAGTYSHGDEQAYIDRMCEINGIPALSAAIWNADSEIYLNYSNGKETANEYTLYELASVSKAFTGLAIMQLHDQGLLSYDDPVQKYIPEFHPTYKGNDIEITLEHLLKHSSGIPDYTIDLIPEQPYTPGGLAGSLSGIFDIELSFEPGAVFDYSTVNYDFLALIIERITETEFTEYVSTHVLDEAGMNDSFFRRDEIQEEVIQGYKQGFLLSLPYDAPVYYGNTAAGYLISDTKDMMKWMKEVKDLFAPEKMLVDPENRYFAGWWLEDDDYDHGGNNPNYTTAVILDRYSPVGVTVLCAKQGGVTTQIIAGRLLAMQKGETVRIGLFCDLYDLVDLIFIAVPLLFLYLVLLLPIRRKGQAIIGIVIGILLLAVLVALPFLLHRGYRFWFVWMPFSFTFAIASIFLFAVYLIIGSVSYLKKR